MLLPLVHRDITYSQAVLIGPWIGGPLYGLNIALYIFYVRLVLRTRTSLRRNLLIALATFQLMMATGHYLTNLPYQSEGFIKHAADPGGSDAWFSSPASPVGTAQLVFYFTNYATGDMIMAWRCYVVWNRSWRIAVLFILLVIASIISGYAAIGYIEELSSAQAVFAVTNWMIASFSLSMGIQICASTLIVMKLWWRAPKNLPSARKQYVFVMWMIVESGAVLAAATATDLTLFLLKMNAGAILASPMTQLACLVPTSIIVRVGLQRKAQDILTLPCHNYQSRSGIMVDTTYRVDVEGSTPESVASSSTFAVEISAETKSIDI